MTCSLLKAIACERNFFHNSKLVKIESSGDNSTMKDNALKAIADPTRRKILELVKDEPASVVDIAKHFDATQQAISQHLQLLRNAGLLEFRKVGTRHLYVVRTDGFEPLAEFLEEFWPERLRALKAAAEATGKASPAATKKG
jgi:DNA-binding transcriptional ArsR family regulator